MSRSRAKFYPARLNRHLRGTRFLWKPLHPKPAQTQPPIPSVKPVRKLLRVESEYFVAGALFTKWGSVWSCTKAAPILKWMVGKTPDYIQVALLKMGASWSWVPLKPRSL